MRVVVLVSAGIHPVSFRPRPVPAEMQAIRLGRDLGKVTGLHAGPSRDAVADALGHGIETLLWLNMPPGSDAVPALVAAIAADPPDLLLAGRHGEGGEDSGLVPYLVAARLGWPIAADAVALRVSGGRMIATQALGGGARREVTMTLPAIVTIGTGAPSAYPFAHAAARRGRIVEQAGLAEPLAETKASERAYRRRPRLVRGAPAGGNAAARLQQATEAAGGTGKLLIDPPPDVAAAAILEFLAGLNLAPSARKETP